MARMKIFYFIPNLQQGGPEGQILELINQLPPRFEPVLCVYHADDIFFDARCPPGQPAHALGVRRMSLAALDRLTEILRREKPAILHSYRDKANFWARWAGARAGVPITITACRNRMMELRYLLIERFMSRFSRLILTNSVGVRHELTEWAGVPDDKIRVITNILDVDQFRPPTPEERAAAARPLGPAAVQPGAAAAGPGRPAEAPDWRAAGDARARRAASRGRPTPWSSSPGRERDRGDQLARAAAGGAADVAGPVRFLGAVKDIRSLYWASRPAGDAFALRGAGQRRAGRGRRGLPALLSHAANVDGIVQPGVTGWEIPPGTRRR